jgi:wyosine [tRNA(Phe)-imidazoG37] synthetase (radical SAM superfamily)
MTTTNRSLRAAFASHPRRWRDFLYAYPVISRRSKGLSIGINLNPDTACNFDCIYCSVDRTIQPRVRTVDLGRLRFELDTLVGARSTLFDEPEFRGIPAAYRRLNDLAFSGDGEPTTSPMFPDAARIAVDTLERFGLSGAKVVVITDACYLTRPAVAETLHYLDQHNGEIWAKLDAGTEDYFRRINRPNFPLQHVLDNILAAARIRPIVLQSLFMRVRGEPPPEAEIRAFGERVRWLLTQGGQVRLLQIYTVARRTAEPYVTPLTAEELEKIADVVRRTGVIAESYP